MRTFSHIPSVTVEMSVYDYADLLRKYAPLSDCVVRAEHERAQSWS